MVDSTVSESGSLGKVTGTVKTITRCFTDVGSCASLQDSALSAFALQTPSSAAMATG